MKNKLRILFNIFFVLVVLIFGSSLSTFVASGFDRTQSNIFGFQSNIVQSGSMEPVIMTHDFVLTKMIDFDDVKIGDVITYRNHDVVIIHRVVEKYENYLITKGDNNPHKDEWKVYPEDIIGKTVKKY